ncbi:MAG: urea transporter [Candidatus Riflebacteria bacterium]
MHYLKIPLFQHLTAYGAIIFVPKVAAGFLLLVLGFIHPNIAISGLIAVASLFLFGTLSGLSKDNLLKPAIIYNPLLVGMSIGALYRLDFSMVFFIATASFLTFVTTLVIENFLASSGAPVLSLPFAIVSTVVYLGSWKFGNLFVLNYYDFTIFTGAEAMLPNYITFLLKSIGSIVFMPNVLSGSIILVMMFFHSRIMVFWALVSFYSGVLIHSSLVGSFEMAIYNPYAFNYILVGLALGGSFLVSSLRTGCVLMAAVSVTVMLVGGSSRFAELYRIPVFTLPFNCTVIPFIIAMKIAGFKESIFVSRGTPEASLTHYIDFQHRFKSGQPSVGLPIAGKVTIMQSFDGHLTHKGKWKHALDFQIRENEKTFIGDPAILQSYFVFGKTVLSPVAGYVAAIRNDLPDNQMGKLDHINNWGNFIIIRTIEGYFIELSHFMQNSILVSTGQWVYQGAPLGKVGNSGYSLEPHLHMQVQNTGFLGDKTVEFNIDCFKSEGSYYFGAVPRKDDKVEAVIPEFAISQKLSFILGTVFSFTWEKREITGGKESSRSIDFNIRVSRTEDAAGLFFFEDDFNGKLFFTLKNNAFYFYDFIGDSSSPLRLFMAALPRLPLCSSPNIPWYDSLPIHVYSTGIHKEISQFLAGLGVPVKIRGKWFLDAAEQAVKGEINGLYSKMQTSLKFDKEIGFSEIRVNNDLIRKREIKFSFNS